MPEILKDTIGPQKQFHEFLAKGEFKIQRSKVTGEYFFHPRVAFPGTGDRDLEWVEVSGNGIVHSTSCNRRLPEKGGDFGRFGAFKIVLKTCCIFLTQYKKLI